MKIALLTHERELHRKTNSGQLVISCLGDLAERIVWDRVNPDANLVTRIENKDIFLMYPGPNSESSEKADIDQVENILIIDATWQEANKIFNRSPYLKQAQKFALTKHCQSNYQLRRNQPEGGLCTAECVIEFLKLKGENHLATTLQQTFELFNQRRP